VALHITTPLRISLLHANLTDLKGAFANPPFIFPVILPSMTASFQLDP